MRHIFRNCETENEYATALTGRPYYRNSGIIYAVDQRNRKYAVGRVDFERFDDQNYQYVFSPEWSVIDTLPASIFQGIPGLDMSLRLERYYRVNMTPYFISERTPSESREDLWDLLEEVGLDYYDRFEWLLRTDMRCGIDNLIVERAIQTRQIQYDSRVTDLLGLQPSDCITIKSFDHIATTNYQFREQLIQILKSGAQIWDESENRVLSEEECSILLKIMLIQEKLDGKNKERVRSEGIAKAKNEGKYRGRKRIDVDPNLLKQVSNDLKDHKITETVAMDRVGIKSRSTFYRRLKEV